MGVYTALKIRCKIKPEYCPIIEELHKVYSWDRVSINFPEYNWLDVWARIYRADFIPFGSMAIYPDWNESTDTHSTFENGEWYFCCSLKNYENEISDFVDLVFLNIVEELYECKMQYESNPSDSYTLEQLKEYAFHQRLN